LKEKFKNIKKNAKKKRKRKKSSDNISKYEGEGDLIAELLIFGIDKEKSAKKKKGLDFTIKFILTKYKKKELQEIHKKIKAGKFFVFIIKKETKFKFFSNIFLKILEVEKENTVTVSLF